MESGRFITCRDYPDLSQGNPWATMGKEYNSRDRHLFKGPGLLTVRRTFDVDEDTCHVTLNVTSLGIFEILLNGERVMKDGEADELPPLWTDYRFRVMEFTYDLSPMMKKGQNELLFRVSPGWWSGRISFGMYGYKPCALCAEIRKTLSDGSTITDGSGPSWQSAMAGPVSYADIWNGEYDDFTMPDPVTEPSKIPFADSVLFEDTTAEIVPFKGARVLVNGTLSPLSAVTWEKAVPDGTTFGHIEPCVPKRLGCGCEKAVIRPGMHLTLDLGQNMVGRPVIEIRTPKGAHVTVFVAEMLNDSGRRERGNDGPMGSIYIENYRSALARYECQTRESTEAVVLRPLHTFYGFRYIEISADAEVEILKVTGEVVGSRMEEYGNFSCSDAEVNQLVKNIRWGMRGNYLSVPTDCPQRDERLGWTGDTQIFCGAASYLSDIRGFMEKWLLYDASDAQKGHEGAYSDVIPRLDIVGDGAAAWGDAGIIVPYRMYLMYNDTELLSAHYASMEAYMTYLERYGFDGPKTSYGDWLNYDVTDKRYIAVCYYAYDALLMVRISAVLGFADRVAYYEDLREKIIGSYLERYTENGEITVKTQTGYILPLAFEMLTGQMRETAVLRLAEKIRENDDTLSTGFVGTGMINQTLSSVGLDTLAYNLLLQTKDPSWLYSVRQGATTVWERWNSYTLDKGFGEVVMNSFNHYAYGVVAEWLFGYVAGIRPDPEHPGFDGHAVLGIRPDFRSDREIPQGQKRITSASGTFRDYSSSWAFQNGRLVWKFSIPRGEALIEYPIFKKVETLTINDIIMTPEELGASCDGHYLKFRLGAGTYTIGGELCGF